jgi:hypothetical protein
MKGQKLLFRLSLVFISSLLIPLLNCKKTDNPVLEYMQHAELQFEGKEQKVNIVTALNDILDLSEEQLKTKRYTDYTGNDNKWDLSMLIYRHFIPDKKGESLGNDFYHDVKSEEVQKEIRKILERLE